MTDPTPEQRIAKLEAAVEALEPTGGYPAPSKGYRWIPYFSDPKALWALPIIGAAAGLAGAVTFTRALEPAKGKAWDQTVLTNVFLMDIALVLLGLGLGLVLGEVNRLEKIGPIRGVATPSDTIEKTLNLFKGLTAGRLIFAVGFILLLSNAYLAKK